MHLKIFYRLKDLDIFLTNLKLLFVNKASLSFNHCQTINFFVGTLLGEKIS